MIFSVKQYNPHQLQQNQMKKLLNYINGTTLDQASEQILSGKVNAEVYMMSLQNFKKKSTPQRHEFIMKFTERLKQKNKPHKILACLLMFDKMKNQDFSVCLPLLQFTDVFQKNQKQTLALINLMSFYGYFLKCSQASQQAGQNIQNCQQTLKESITMCEIIGKKITELFKVQFIMMYALKGIEHHHFLIKEIVKHILMRIRDDLQIMKHFVNSNLELTLQNSFCFETKVEINMIYEKLIFIMKNIDKLEAMSSRAGLKIIFPKYTIDKELNKKVQLVMKQREIEKKSFLKERQHKILPIEQINEDDIMISSAQSFLYLNSQEM